MNISFFLFVFMIILKNKLEIEKEISIMKRLWFEGLFVLETAS